MNANDLSFGGELNVTAEGNHSFGGGTRRLPPSPPNGHLVMIDSGSRESTKNNDGAYLRLMATIMEGPQAGVSGAIDFNLWNKNATTCQIAQRQLEAIAAACGVFGRLSDPTPLFGKPFRVIVIPDKNPENAAKGYTDCVDVLRADGSKLNEPAGSAQAAPQGVPGGAPGGPGGFPPPQGAPGGQVAAAAAQPQAAGAMPPQGPPQGQPAQQLPSQVAPPQGQQPQMMPPAGQPQQPPQGQPAQQPAAGEQPIWMQQQGGQQPPF